MLCVLAQSPIEFHIERFVIGFCSSKVELGLQKNFSFIIAKVLHLNTFISSAAVGFARKKKLISVSTLKKRLEAVLAATDNFENHLMVLRVFQRKEKKRNKTSSSA